jgi:hypothetical protein
MSIGNPSFVDRVRRLGLSALAGAVGVSVTLVSPPLVGPAVAEPRPDVPAVSDEAADSRAAQNRARATGKRQEVTAARTEYDTAYVNPSGTTTRVMSAVPVRVRRDGGWTAIDTTLARRTDGSVGPRATVLDVAFSGGGAQPLAVVRRGAAALTVSAPWTLPEPILSGDTAVYPEVLPGVDLAMKAEAEGYREVLVVKNRAAANQPGLRKLRFALRAAGLTVRKTAGGGLTAVDATGDELFHAAPPTMWDSSSAGDGASRTGTGAGRTSISGPVEGDEVAPMDLAVDGTALQVTPDAGLLVSPDTRFPVYIDPAMNATRTQWAMVNQTFPTTSYYKWSNGSDNRGEGMGYVSTAADGTHLKRLYYAFNTGALNVSGRTIVSATFRAFQTWSYNCTSAGVEAWLTNGFTSGMTWNKQPTWVGPHTARTAPKYGRPDCAPGGAWVDFNVRNQVIAAQLKPWATTTIGLKASNEASSTGWRRFRNDATLEVEYNTYPNVPTSPQMLSPTTSCGGSVPGGDLPIMQVKVTDPDGTQNQVRARFQIFKSGETTPQTFTTSPGASGTTFRQQMPNLANGMWTWRAQGLDAGNLASGWTALCNVTVDNSAPTPPMVWFHGGDLSVGGDLDFQFTGGAADVVSYRYAVNGDAPTSPAISVWDGRAKVRVTSFGPFTLRVWAYDAAGNRGAAASWPPEDPLIIGGTDALDWWRMNDGGGTSAANVKRPANGFLLQGAFGWEPDAWADTGTALALNAPGAMGGALGAGGPADGGHFSVSAWLKVGASSGTGRRVAVSQDAGLNSAFSLAVERTAGPAEATPMVVDRVVATLYKPDGSVGLRVPSSLALEPGQWVHATMSRINQPDGTVALELWVTDAAAGETIANAATETVSTAALAGSANGYTRVGAEARNAVAVNHFVGAVDEVVTAKGPFDEQQRAYWRKPVP